MNRERYLQGMCLILAVAFWLVPARTQAEADSSQRWSLIGFTKYRDAVYFDKKGVTSSSPGLVKTWIMIAPSDRSRYSREARRELQKHRGSVKGFQHTEIETEMDCENNKMRFLQNRYFNEDGQVMYAQNYSDRQWREVQPGSLWDRLRQVVCGHP